MRLYPIVRAIHAGYPLAVFWCYVGIFALAFAMVFVFPPGPIIMLLLGLAGLAAVVTVYKLLEFVRNTIARIIINGGACPSCGRGIEIARDASETWRCAECGHEFLPSGGELVTNAEDHQ